MGFVPPRGPIFHIWNSRATGKGRGLRFPPSTCCLVRRRTAPSLADEGNGSGTETVPLIALLDGLDTDRSPEDRSTALKIASKERDLGRSYVPFLVWDEKRARALLEILSE